MNQLKDLGIVLRRTDYGEADRIITVLTPQHGKIRVIAKGVRKQKSKLAGGIELFSVSELQFIKGRGDIDTLTSTRLQKHFGVIVQDLERTQAGYEFLKVIMRATEGSCEAEYFYLVEGALEALNDPAIDLHLIRAWFYMTLLQLAGHQPELHTDSEGQPLTHDKTYAFDFEAGRFRPIGGDFGTDSTAIKLLRLLTEYAPAAIAKVGGVVDRTGAAAQLLKQMSEYYIQAMAVR